MFGIPAVYLKIAGFVTIVAALYGGYYYVSNLRSTVKELQAERTQLIEMNNTLTESLAEIQRMQEVRDKVSAVSQNIRNKNKVVKERRSAIINDSVAEGKDREVGPLLKEFFNAK